MATSPFTLAVDIGGTAIKSLMLDVNSMPVTGFQSHKTPRPATPRRVIETIRGILNGESSQPDRVSIGFPGIVRHGVTLTAPNLHPAWEGRHFSEEMSEIMKAPVRVVKDAEMHGLGAITGKGVEMVITLGTGLGSSLFTDGHMVPNLDLGHHPLREGLTYEEILGKKALEQNGEPRWAAALRQAITQLQSTFNYDMLFIGGGNAARLVPDTLPENVSLITNAAALLGALSLWDCQV
jgi:polyphosphate glucokinase